METEFFLQTSAKPRFWFEMKTFSYDDDSNDNNDDNDDDDDDDNIDDEDDNDDGGES